MVVDEAGVGLLRFPGMARRGKSMEQAHALPGRVPLGSYFLARLERLLTLPAGAIAARGEPGLALLESALHSTFGDCRTLGYAQDAVMLLLAAHRAPAGVGGE